MESKLTSYVFLRLSRILSLESIAKRKQHNNNNHRNQSAFTIDTYGIQSVDGILEHLELPLPYITSHYRVSVYCNMFPDSACRLNEAWIPRAIIHENEIRFRALELMMVASAAHPLR